MPSAPASPDRPTAHGAAANSVSLAGAEVEIKGLVEARFGLALDYAVWNSTAEMIRGIYEDQRPDFD